MFAYFFLLFVIFNRIKNNIYLNYNKFNGYDNRNLTSNNIITKTNLSIIFNKYELLKKLKSNKYNIHQKLEIIDNNIIHQVNILNGGLLEDWDFDF